MNYLDIITLIGNKDPKGLEELYQAYGKKFFGYSVNQWHLSEDEAWEVVYKTLETLVLKLSNYHFESQTYFDNFLYKVLFNFLRQHFRAKRSHEDKLVLVDLYEDQEKMPSLTRQLDAISFQDYYKSEIVENPVLLALNDALSQLEGADKDILLLRAQNYSYDEIAAMLNIDNKQLKVKHHRAKQKLINILNEPQQK
jgi:RNA polymerase sigma factor (sigma-70 family)